MDDPKPKTQTQTQTDQTWRGPSISEIAREARLGTATVDRVLNGRIHVREATREKVLSALERLKQPLQSAAGLPSKRITVLSESGVTFNATLEASVLECGNAFPDISLCFVGVASGRVEPIKFANLIERTAEESDALIVVAREDIVINRALRNVVARKVPVVCLTSDLPNSGRAAYIGSDQIAAGSTAAHLMGQLVGERDGKILLVYSAPYRAQEERELGFRRVLRTDFNQLEIDDRVNSNDDSEHSYRHVMSYLKDHGTPAGIYNTVGGNTGIGKALKEHNLVGKVIFIGHELNTNSRQLLESGIMNFVIGHDVLSEVEAAVKYVIAAMEKKTPALVPQSRVRIYTKYSCN
jgi:LacI family transcriptional regulator